MSSDLPFSSSFKLVSKIKIHVLNYLFSSLGLVDTGCNSYFLICSAEYRKYAIDISQLITFMPVCRKVILLDEVRLEIPL